MRETDKVEGSRLVGEARRAGLIKPSPRQLYRERRLRQLAELAALEDAEDTEPWRLCPVCDHRTRLPDTRLVTRGKLYGCTFWTCAKCGAEHLGEGSLIK